MKKILIVDDEFGITKFLKIAIERSGPYEVHVENEGSLAVSKIRSLKPDLVFLDVNMPNTSGGEILAEIKSDPEFEGLAVIFLTGSVSEDEVAEGISIGGYPALAKPIDLPKLMAMVDKSLK